MMYQVVNYIMNHGSAESPTNNRDICNALSTHEQVVRKAINEARCSGIPICSCHKGYWYSEDKSEILETVRSLMSRTMSVQKAADGLLTVLQRGVGEI